MILCSSWKNWSIKILRSLCITPLAWTCTQIDAAQVPPVRIMPLGDSITAGCCSSAPTQGGYRNKLYTLLTEAGYNVDFVGTEADSNNPTLPDQDHQGMNSYRIDQIQSALPNWLRMTEDPDVVLLNIGSNDFWQGYDLASVQTRLNNLITDIAIQRPFAKILVSNLFMRTDDVNTETLQESFNAAIPGIVNNQVAQGRQVSFVDMHAVSLPGDLSSDGIHPNATGYNKMAEVWSPAIQMVIAPLGSTEPPAIVRTEPLVDRQHVTVRFSKPLADSAANLANFSLNRGLIITQALLDPVTKRSIVLTTGTQSAGVVYTLSVQGILDNTTQQRPITPGASVDFSPDVLINPSFEADFAGWTMTGNQTSTHDAPYFTTNGNGLVVFNGGDELPNGILSQTFPTVSGNLYTLSFDTGVLAYNKNLQVMQVSVTGSSTLLSQMITVKGLDGGIVNWSTQNFTFIADSGSTTLTFQDQSATTQAIDLMLDNVRLSATSTPPIAATETYATDQDQTLAVSASGVLANDTDPDGNVLTAQLDASPSYGSLILNSNGSFIYTPVAGFIGADLFTYHASDGTLNSNIVTVHLTVTAKPSSLLANSSFESSYTGWAATGSQEVVTYAPYLASDGSSLVVFNGDDQLPDAVLAQTFDTVVGQTYSLSCDVGVIAYNKNQQKLGITVTGTGGLLSEIVALNGLGDGTIRWQTNNFTFVADNTTTTLTFRDQSTTTLGLDLLLDNVRMIKIPPYVLPPDPLLAQPLKTPSWVMTPDAVKLQLITTQVGTYVLERSEDLISWQYVSEIKVTATGPIELLDNQNSQSARISKRKMFYRVALNTGD